MTELNEGFFERALALAKSLSRPVSEAELERRADRLLTASPERRVTLLANAAAFRAPQLADWLIDRSFEMRFDDPVEGVRLARVALEVAESLPRGPLRPVAVDAESRAMAYLGNAHRVIGDFAGASTWFERAEARLGEGSCDPMLVGEVSRLKARFASELGDSLLAYRLYRAAFLTYADLRETNLACVVLVDLGRTMIWAGDDKVGRRILIETLQLLQNERPDPVVLISAFHSMAYSLAQIGLLDDAIFYLKLPRPLYALLPGDLARLRCQWMEGTLLERVGSNDDARLLLGRTREAYLWRSLDYDAALVALDLALVLLKERKWEEVESLARESYAAFAARGLSDRATAALLLFVEAAQQRTVAEELVKRVAGEIRGGQREAWAAELSRR